MFPSPSLPWFELARFKRSRLTRVALLAVLTVPLFYGGLYIWANIDPTNRLDNVQAAVVNEDEMIEVEGSDGEAQQVAVGRLLAAELIGDDSEQNYDWVLTDARDAQEGLADGEYKAVLTIPKNLSEASTSTDDPEQAVQGELDLVTDDAVNYVNGAVAQSILRAARSSLNSQVTETYLDNIYLSFSDIKMALDEAGDGAGDLADGAEELAAGTDELADGAATLADGNRQLADGASQLDAGAGELAAGLGQLQDQTSSLPGDTRQLADGSRQVADGVDQLNGTVQEVSGAILAGTEDAEAIEQQLRDFAELCREQAPEGLDCSLVEDAADQSGAVIGDIRGQAGEIGGQTQQLADGARQVARGNAELAAGVPQLVDAIGTAATGAGELAGATGELSTGADQAAAGADELASGTQELASGADALAAGALELQNGLTDGAEGVPDYTEDEREKLAETAATPVEDAIDRANGVSSYGAGLAPYFLALALWVGAMAIYLLLRPLSQRALASTAGPVRTALAGFAPGLALSLLQAVLLVGLVVGALGIDPARPWVLLGLAALTGAVFTAINQMFVALFGGAGRFVALVFVCLQLTAAGGTYPIETAPGFFGFLHSLLPMTYAVSGMRTAIAGGGAGLVTAAVVLVLFGLAALAVTVLTAQRRQTVTMSRLHPVLQV
ncbi:YhgE/Pip family protein [Aeromicrobium sp. CF4.19]|uniref:YhgE/Pip family protein n=1 Tax=Aeromicrobium sp. CF4.19 TaxID=3373082 RepID=UPI003EE5A25B